ncbi:MAG: hypothetical protein GOVbin3250_6 [Prokaryotic dsDNA virus sp.]|nr:MAG: hypothetical protein GOVbin3250_6 [Prokaryotic dsDNA virus sp.]
MQDMQNKIIVITFQSGLIQYIKYSLDAIEYIYANFGSIEDIMIIGEAQ